jgi:hypothetical protein
VNEHNPWRTLRRQAIIWSMGPSERIERFRDVVFADPELQERLRGIRDWDAFVAASVDAAARRGLELSAEDVLAAREERRRSWRERWV